MAVALPKLSSGSAVRIRFTSLDVGTTKWREGIFEVHERDNKSNLVLKFNSGGAPKHFQLNHNVKNVVLGPIHSQNRLSLTLKDSNVVILERLPITVAKN
ncbi:hypothetical protein HF521_016558 [Silurus meridionalis]|uniref:ubiquitinyl hydrolase 1 n=1 Tax=Silurus meridionalis TaxID=175797 RepID=A0A8T0BRN2_SILME|nr:hypothetical protein HF521_016558 [Silurus meridionalis]